MIPIALYVINKISAAKVAAGSETEAAGNRDLPAG
jgi:hypothetical protein